MLEKIDKILFLFEIISKKTLENFDKFLENLMNFHSWNKFKVKSISIHLTGGASPQCPPPI